ncbi:Yme2p [Sporobolomyces salmoneus]|uniref:Yme2p n=1 Tax=Sporobolomyces salmoneus TaxID=183962 RepID=UPI00317C6F96
MLQLRQLRRPHPVSSLHKLAPLPNRLSSTLSSSPATQVDEEEPTRKSFYLYYNLLFPLRTSLLDVRYLLTRFQRPELLASLSKQLEPLDKRYEGVKVEEIKTREKDGGAFVRISWDEQRANENELGEEKIRSLVEDEAQHALEKAAFKPWFNVLNQTPKAFLVKGRPWMEDMNRFPSRELIVEFEGPEIPQERLYELFRPYGKIHDIVPSSPKSASIIFTSLRSATSARNCLHSSLIQPSSPNVTTPTLVRILYKPKRHFAYFRDWVASHPKIVLPLVVALLGTISYAVFDPVREFFVQAKVTGTFDADQWRAVKWLKKETLGRLGLTSSGRNALEGGMSGIEKEREDAKEDLKNWLKGNPESFITVQGPRGSGKTALVDEVLVDGRNILTIDCKKICKAARTDTKLVSELASAVGYYPQFVLASSLNNMIDLAAVGLIGQKAGFSSNLDTQLKAILEVTASALAKLSGTIRSRSLASSASASSAIEHKQLKDSVARQLVEERTIRDGRIDAVAGNGAMSELGAGVETPLLSVKDENEVIKEEKMEIVGPRTSELVKEASKSLKRDTIEIETGEGKIIKEKEPEMERLPVVIIKGFAAKGEAKQEVLWDVLAEFAAIVVENQIAHVIFTSDSPTLSKPLAKALPSKPFNSITLTDASPEASLQYVSTKLSAFSKPLPPDCHSSVARLGGRQTDLELLIEKVRAGQDVEEATDDIVCRSATEIRKSFFGDDEEEAKGLKWKREQAGAIIQGLCEKGELKYAETLIKVFGGDEASLRALENHELISITHRDGRPSIIKPGRPVYRSAFSLLLSDPIFLSTLEYRSVTSALSSASADLKASQAELLELSKLFVPDTGKWSLGGGSRTPKEVELRVKKTLEKMRTSEEKVEQLTVEKARLLKVFAENE